MTEQDPYVLGYRQAEQERLQQQAQQLAHESSWLFDEIAVTRGARVVEIGCGPHGCLDLLSERVGPAGRVVGVERSAEAVALARRLISQRNLGNVDVLEGDARSTGLPRASFDFVTSRLVLVNVPQPEQIVAEAAALVRPGGWVAFHEADYVSHVCDPPSAAWTTSCRTAADLLREEWNRSADRAEAAAPSPRGRPDRCSGQSHHSRLPAGPRSPQPAVGFCREPERATRRAETDRRIRADRVEGRPLTASCRSKHACRLASLLSVVGT